MNELQTDRHRLETRAPNCRKCAGEMGLKSKDIIPGTKSYRLVFSCEKCGIETMVTTRVSR